LKTQSRSSELFVATIRDD